MKCEYCSKEHDGSFGSRRFCNRSCANTRILSEETKRKISKSIRKFILEDTTRVSKKRNFACEYCGSVISDYRDRKYCNVVCAGKGLRLKTEKSSRYRADCAFSFNIYEYPNKFDLSLIEKYCCYSAANRGNNLNGISRDHIISIKYGFKNDIPVEIMSHPANCQLLNHSDNISKGKKNGMSLEELYNKVKKW